MASIQTITKTRTIAINTAVSTAFRTMGEHGAALMNVRVRVDGWTAAALYFQFSEDGTNWYNVMKVDNTPYGFLTADVIVDQWLTINDVPAFSRYMRFVSSNDVGNANVNQLAARTLNAQITFVA